MTVCTLSFPNYGPIISKLKDNVERQKQFMKDTKANTPNFGNLGKEEVDELKVGYQFHQLIPVEILIMSMPVQSRLYKYYTFILQNAAEKIRQSLYDPKKVSHFHNQY